MTRKRSIDWLIKNYLPFLEQFGMDEKNIRENYTKNWENKDRADVYSYLWSIFNVLIDENFKQSQGKSLEGYYSRNSKIYGQMATFLVKYKKKPAGHIQKAYNENSLQSYFEGFKDNSFQIDVKIICGAVDCKYGKELEEKIFTMEEALEDSIIPYEKCTNDLGCFCSYFIVPKRDDNNNLIFKDGYQAKTESKNKGFWSRLFS